MFVAIGPLWAFSKEEGEIVENIRISQEAGDAGARDLHVARETSRVGEGRKEGPRGDQSGGSPLAIVVEFTVTVVCSIPREGGSNGG